ncbi:single hybrid motif-containing protein [Crucibulum laeve]|uniref:Single hybrid motif-containing protein n=1 Tax=Crucibulum laeve TaxID=68775 RepID=A0A5C3LPL4_9AGAR|nr:single hybrid motif-containing protein [Crucibulum laeve]
MASLRTLTSLSSAARRCTQSRRLLHQTHPRHAITNLQMPAMSPTMTEGGIASWKKKDGEAFSTGDVLLEIETDKATIDVEAQDDGVMGKILLPDGSKNVPVGKVIALLAEEGDDISNLQPPAEEPKPPKQEESSAAASSSSPSPSPAQEPSKSIPEIPTPKPSHGDQPPAHSRPLFPSVHRLLLENNIANPEEIKGTGVRGMLTKGDVLAYLGKASGPTGTFKETPSHLQDAVKPAEKKEAAKPLDGPTVRRLIVSSMLQSSLKARNPQPIPTALSFDDIIADYLPSAPKSAASPKVEGILPAPASKSTPSYLDGLF